jgi:hypothetical protein
MRAVVRGVDVRALRGEEVVEVLPHGLILLLREQATRDAGLVRDHDGRQTHLVQTPHGSGSARYESDLLRSRDVVGVVDERAVAIEEDRRSAAGSRTRSVHR